MSQAITLVKEWADKHRIESLSDYAKADLAALIEAISRRAEDDGRKGRERQFIEYDPPV